VDDEALRRQIQAKKAALAAQLAQGREGGRKGRLERRSRLATYAALERRVAEHIPRFDAFVEQSGRRLVEAAVLAARPEVCEVDPGERDYGDTAFDERRYLARRGVAHLTISMTPLEGFYRDDVLLTHRVSLCNESWFPDPWHTFWDLPCDLSLLDGAALRALVRILEQHVARVDGLVRDPYEPESERMEVFEGVCSFLEERLLAASVLAGPFQPFGGWSGRRLCSRSARKGYGVYLDPAPGQSVGFEVGPSDSRSHHLPLATSLRPYDCRTDRGRERLADLAALLAALVVDNEAWSGGRQVYDLQYDGY
jgi:hypothetical protein